MTNGDWAPCFARSSYTEAFSAAFAISSNVILPRVHDVARRVIFIRVIACVQINHQIRRTKTSIYSYNIYIYMIATFVGVLVARLGIVTVVSRRAVKHDGIRGGLGPEASGGDGQGGAVHDGVGAVPGRRADTPRHGERYTVDTSSCLLTSFVERKKNCYISFVVTTFVKKLKNR